ncbi:hypothetical protein ACVI9W_000702 [Pseudomonas sp. 210_17 TE3656]
MSVAELAGQPVPITEADTDALTVAGAVDGRRHLKSTGQTSIIWGLYGCGKKSDTVFIEISEPVMQTDAAP